jgi:acyl dehydratase
MIYARAALGALPGAGRLPFLAGGGGEIPDQQVELSAVTVDAARLAEYCRVCGFTLRDELPATYPHVLAFPLHMALLTDSRFPFPAVGLVHLENSITQHRPVGTGEPLDLHVTTGPLESHPKGRTFPIITTVRSAGEVVWESRSLTLRRGGGSGGDDARAQAGSAEEADLRVEASWSLPGDLGRRYASVSGDRNPIHLYGVTAKAFGFPRQIAHGMWTKARCVAALQARLPQAFTVDVAFKRPLLIPSKVELLSSEPGARSLEFEVRAARDGAPHLRGRVE